MKVIFLADVKGKGKKVQLQLRKLLKNWLNSLV